MQLTKSQKLMSKDGAPDICFMSEEQRRKLWEANPPRPMPMNDLAIKKSLDPATVKLMEELEETKKNKTSTRIRKMLSKKEDHTNDRWDSRKGKWVPINQENKPMISITTNTRGSTKMATKDYADMSGPELVAAYNKRSGKPAIKKFKDKATGLAAMAKLDTEKAAAAKAAKSVSAAGDKPKTEKKEKEGSANKLAAEFKARVGSFREKLIIAFDENYRKFVAVPDLLKAVYGSKNLENTGALTMVVKGAETMITKSKLPYELKKDKNKDTKEISFGLWPK